MNPQYGSLNGAAYQDLRGGNVGECFQCGAAVPWSNRTQHTNFHLTYSNVRNDTMSEVKWCDRGNHAFKAGEPGSVSFNGSQVGDDGKTVDERVDACRLHNPFKPEAAYEQIELQALTDQAHDELLRGHNRD